MPLSDPNCRNAKGGAKPYKLSDGEGLYLFVQPNGSRLWRLAYRFGGKQKTLAFGAYPYVSLAEARQKRTQAKTALAAGRDPAIKEDAAESFESVARRWFASESAAWKPSHATRVISRIERDAFPAIGAKPIDRIEPMAIVALLRAVEDRGAVEVTKRLLQSIVAIFRFAIAEGRVKYNPAADVGGALKPAPRVKHFATLKAADIPELIRDIDAYDGQTVTRLAILFTLHTFVRTSEVRFAPWSEIEELDGKAPLWRIPAERMKMGREHLVPLSQAAVDILKQMQPFSDGGFIFPGNKRRPMSENTMLFGLYRMGYHSRLTVHGFRGMASTVLNEQGFNSDHIERQLAHVEENKIRGAYNSAEWMPARRKMMTWWSSYLNNAAVMQQAA